MMIPCIHIPDWGTSYLASNGGEIYIDISCKLCGLSGCVSMSKTSEYDIQWKMDDDNHDEMGLVAILQNAKTYMETNDIHIRYSNTYKAISHILFEFEGEINVDRNPQ